MARTKSCKKCGEVLYTIVPMCEEVSVVCNHCKTTNTVNCGKYTTYEKICSSCLSDVFKIRVSDYRSEEKISIECTECKGGPETYYIDKEGNRIDRQTRELLIIQDNIEKVEDNVNGLEDRLEEIDSRLESMEYDVSGLSSRVSGNKEYINSIEYDLDAVKRELDREVSSLERELNDLSSTVHQLERNMN